MRWELEYVGARPLTTNKARTMHFREWGPVNKMYREYFAWKAQQARIPHLDQIMVVATPLHKNRQSPQDAGACSPAVKASIDGLVDAHVIDDDGPAQLISIMFMQPDICGRDGLRLEIVEVVRDAA
jgi:hypothetical protein